MLEKKYKILTKKELLKLYGGWGYSLAFRDNRSWERAVLKWIKR